DSSGYGVLNLVPSWSLVILIVSSIARITLRLSTLNTLNCNLAVLNYSLSSWIRRSSELDMLVGGRCNKSSIRLKCWWLLNNCRLHERLILESAESCKRRWDVGFCQQSNVSEIDESHFSRTS
ncbi:hypothetical protein Tco_1395023, partial [Tanacetum coccineum]